MLQKIKNRRKEEGFTIIEVMIVLAIAGLIMLIVFLAVPALQRNARNTQRKEDAAQIASAVSNFISNNGGTLPTCVKADADGISLDVYATGTSPSCTGNYEAAKLGYYTAANVSLLQSQASPTLPDSAHIVIDTGYSCNAASTGLGNSNARSSAILYALENTGTNTTAECVEQ